MHITDIVLQYFCLLFSLCVHEASHAAMADRCGDPTARLLGRLTLNPLRHIDPIGTVALPLLAMFTGFPYMFGWAKPVPYNPRNLRNLRRDEMLVSLAGPGSNLIIALACVFLLRALAALLGVSPDSAALETLLSVFIFMMFINLLLMLFNLIPLPPLDGHRVLTYFMSYETQKKFNQIGGYNTLILFVLIFYFRILTVPMELLTKGFMFLSFYGTPIFEMLGKGAG